MSSHRKRVGLPVTGMYSNVLPNQLPPELRVSGPYSTLPSRAASSTESDPSPAQLPGPLSPWPIDQPGFPGILDKIWCNGNLTRSEVLPYPWSGGSQELVSSNHELVSDVSLASSSDLGTSVFGRHDQPLLAIL